MKQLLLAICTIVSVASYGQEMLRPMPANWKLAPQLVGTFTLAAPALQKSVSFIPSDFYTRHLAFFCRQELKMQQAHVPVTFRLGSMDDCNYLEEKPGYKYPNK